MQEVKKIDRLVNEICHKANVECYRSTIKSILEVVYKHGAVVSCAENQTASSINEKHIRLSTVGLQAPENIIWNLLHEFGHLLDGPRLPTDNDIDREITAWEYALALLEKYPDLVVEKISFEVHRDWCLETYYKRHNIPIEERKMWK